MPILITQEKNVIINEIENNRYKKLGYCEIVQFLVFLFVKYLQN